MTSLLYSTNLTIGIKFNLPYCYIITLRPSMLIEIWYDSMFFVIHLHRGEYTMSVEGGCYCHICIQDSTDPCSECSEPLSNMAMFCKLEKHPKKAFILGNEIKEEPRPEPMIFSLTEPEGIKRHVLEP